MSNAVSTSTFANVVKGAYEFYRDYGYWRLQEHVARRPEQDQLALQWRRLQRIVAFAYQRVPFYRERLDQAGVDPARIHSQDDLRRIPILTKDDIRRNFPDRMLDVARRYRPQSVQRTSGSTGEGLHFVPASQGWVRSLYYNVFLRIGPQRNTPVFVLTTPCCTPNSCSLHPEQSTADQLLERSRFFRHFAGLISLPSYEGNILRAPDAYCESIVARLRTAVTMRRSALLIVNPVYAAVLARYLRRSGAKPPRLQAMITTFELLTDSTRDLLRDVFGCAIFSQYGSSEIHDIANECECGRFHARVDTVMVEAIRQGQPAAPGVAGRAIITDLHNFNMPLIRYDLGDVIVPAAGCCDCGRRTAGFTSIEGRHTDLIETRTGELLTPLQIDRAVFRGLEGIAAYRLVKSGRNTYRISILADDGAAPDLQQVRQRCQALVGEAARLRVGVVNDIASQPSGKFRFVYGDGTPPQI